MMVGYICQPQDGVDDWTACRVKQEQILGGDLPPLQCATTALDLDRPGHAPWENALQASEGLRVCIDEIRSKSPDDIPLYAYTTRAGIRLVYSFESLCDPIRANHTRSALIARLSALSLGDISEDKQTKDWVRLFRLPLVVRSDYGPTWEPFPPYLQHFPEAKPLVIIDKVEVFQKQLPPSHIDSAPLPMADSHINLPSVTWQTTTEDDLPEWKGCNPVESAVSLAWQVDPQSGATIPTALAKRIVEVFATYHDGKDKAKLILNPPTVPKAKGMPKDGGRNIWMYQTVCDLCRAAAQVKGASPEMAYGLAYFLFESVTNLLGPDEKDGNWEHIAYNRFPELWAEKSRERAIELAAFAPIQGQAAEATIADIVRNPDAMQAIADAKGVTSYAIYAWYLCARAVGRTDETVDVFLDWFVHNAIAAKPGASGDRTALILDPDLGRYTHTAFASAVEEIRTNPIYSPMKPFLYTAVRDANGEEKIVAVDKPIQFPSRYVDEEWPGDLPACSPIVYKVDRRRTSRGVLYRLPTLWQQVDDKLTPTYDGDYARLLRYFFDDDWDTYGRYYLLQLAKAGQSKPCLLLHGKKGVGKTQFLYACARLYGKSSFASLSSDPRGGSGLGDYTAAILDRGPVVTLDDKRPNSAHIEFVLSSLGNKPPRFTHNVKYGGMKEVEMAPIIIFATNNIEAYVDAMNRACRGPEQQEALASRIIAARPNGSMDEWARSLWPRKYAEAKGDPEEVAFKFAQHLLWEHYAAINDKVQPPDKDSHRGGGNQYAKEVTEMDSHSDDVEDVLAALCEYMVGDAFWSQMVRFPGCDDANWFATQDERRSNRVVMPDSFGQYMQSQDAHQPVGWIMGRWWFVRPNRVALNLVPLVKGGKSITWNKRLEDAGIRWCWPQTVPMRVYDPKLGKNVNSHKVLPVDLFGIAKSVSLHGLGERLRQYVLDLGFQP